MDKITGKITTGNIISAKISPMGSISATVSSSQVVHDKYPDYTGSYEVTPKIRSQILPTKNTSLDEDIVIFDIPYQEVSNPSGGLTATIGLE